MNIYIDLQRQCCYAGFYMMRQIPRFIVLIATTPLFALAISLIPTNSAGAAPHPPHISPASPTSSNTSDAVDRDLIQGLWVWHYEAYSTPEAREKLLSFCQRHGYNRILLQVHLNPDTSSLRVRNPEALTTLIADSAHRGIVVEALDGAKDMAMRKNQPRTLAILDAVLKFNRTLPKHARLAGIHYDIEPYIMEQWKQGGPTRHIIMRDLLEFYTEVKRRLAEDANGLTLAADIPFWYDNKVEPDDHCMIEYNGQTKNIQQHIQDICDYVGIMSYRRHATGPNSVTNVIENELAYAQQIGKFITPALETIKLDESPTISFYGLPASQYEATRQTVIELLQNHPGFGGILTHSYRGVSQLFETANQNDDSH